MGDSVAALLWESELLRARQWLVASRKDKQHENEQLFQRVKMHMGFKDHKRSLQSAEIISEDENDLALDFLGDVDVSDMNALLQAEAAKAAAAVETTETPSKDLMMPLEMPMDLEAPHLKLQAVSMEEEEDLAGVTLGNETGVDELMQELALDVTQLKQLEIEEGKTEESTPPHILKNFGGNNTTTNEETEQFHYMRDISSKSPQAPHKKKVETSGTREGDEVADEMLSWVSGYRDPEVIQRKEKMQRKRKHTSRYGVASEEERRRVLQQVKKITKESKESSDSDSDGSMSSGYSPAEDDEISELDEHEVVVLLSDDCLDSEEERHTVKQKRKRLRQADGPLKKKKSRLRKPTVTRKLTQQSRSSQSKDNGQVASSAESEAKYALATTKSTFVEVDSTNTSSRPVEHLSSEGERKAHGKGSISKMVEQKSTNSHDAHGISSNATEPEKAMELTVLRDRLQKECDGSKVQQKRDTESELTTAALLLADSEAVSGDTACGSVSADSIALEPNITVDSPTVNEKADTDDADLSDTGTIHLEDEELPRQNEHVDEEVTAATTKAVAESDITAELEDVAVTAKRVDRLPDGDLEQSVESDDEDISEAETEILEDDEPSTDDLGLNFSDDSDVGSSNQADQMNDSVDFQRDATDNKKGRTESETKPTHERDSSADPKQEMSKNQKEDKASSLTAGVQQFFDFAPLKLKPKIKTVSSTAPKPLPLHSYTLTHPTVGSSNAEDAFVKSKKNQILPTTPSVGSNGLRPMKRPIATSTTRKGKYLVTRRCTKLLDDVPETQRQQKRQYYTMVSTKNFKSNDTNDLDDEPLAILAKELSNNSEDTPQARYLSYAGAKKTEEPPSYVTNTPRNVSKSRFGGGGALHISSSTVQNFPATSTGQHSQLPDTDVSTGGYRRQPQISIYDALHMDKEESSIEICKATGYKRPSRFKKMQEEAVRNGTPMVKSQMQDKDWDKMPIPKKKKKQTHQADEDVLLQPSKASALGGKSRNKRRKKTFASPVKKSGSSYYGPQASQVATSGKHDSSSRGRRGRERNNCRREDDRKKKRSPSLPSRDRDRYDKKHRVRDDRGRKGSSRSRSRSPSPRRRDYSSNRKRYRSRSRSWSPEKSSERDHRQPSRDPDRQREKNGKRRSPSPKNRDSSKKKTLGEPPQLDEVCQNGKIGDGGGSAKKQKISHATVAPPSPGTSATFDDEGDNVFISDSDDDEKALTKEDIRFDLDCIPIDEDLMTRQVYVTGLNPTVCAEQIEEDFARFGVGVDRETGFSAIEVFACQRNYLGRGDARVTFKTEEGAQEAVEELNSKNVKNSMIHVRRMDVHTQRILTLQIEAVRDTWKCTKTQCRADVSVWNAKCDKCGRKRVYGPSNIKIGAESWLCSLCFTSNESFATSCCGCMEALPEVDRSTFYTS